MIYFITDIHCIACGLENDLQSWSKNNGKTDNFFGIVALRKGLSLGLKVEIQPQNENHARDRTLGWYDPRSPMFLFASSICQ